MTSVLCERQILTYFLLLILCFLWECFYQLLSSLDRGAGGKAGEGGHMPPNNFNAIVLKISREKV